MKKTIIATASILLTACTIAIAEPSETDQKWLAAVQKMTETGQAKVSTASESRVQLLKNWAEKNGFSVKVTQSETSFTVDLTKSVAKN